MRQLKRCVDPKHGFAIGQLLPAPTGSYRWHGSGGSRSVDKGARTGRVQKSTRLFRCECAREFVPSVAVVMCRRCLVVWKRLQPL